MTGELTSDGEGTLSSSRLVVVIGQDGEVYPIHPHLIHAMEEVAATTPPVFHSAIKRNSIAECERRRSSQQ
jgi:hypothetical protein